MGIKVKIMLPSDYTSDVKPLPDKVTIHDPKFEDE